MGMETPFSTNLQNHQAIRSLTDDRAAESLGVTVKTYRKWRTGAGLPSWEENIRKIEATWPDKEWRALIEETRNPPPPPLPGVVGTIQEARVIRGGMRVTIDLPVDSVIMGQQVRVVLS